MKIKEKHSKMNNISTTKLECNSYLTDKRLTPDEVKLIFSLRTRSYFVKKNYRNKFQNDLLCFLCRTDVDENEHLLKCRVLQNKISEVNSDATYMDLFGTTDEIVKAGKLLSMVCAEREEIMKALNIKFW